MRKFAGKRHLSLAEALQGDTHDIPWGVLEEKAERSSTSVYSSIVVKGLGCHRYIMAASTDSLLIERVGAPRTYV